MRRTLAVLPSEVWRAARDASRYLAHEDDRPRRGLELANLAHVLLDPKATDEARDEAAAMLARDLPPRVRRPGAWRAWKAEGREVAAALGCSLDEALRRLLTLAIKATAERADVCPPRGEPNSLRWCKHGHRCRGSRKWEEHSAP